MSDLSQVKVITFDIDGTLTDATTWWAGGEVGWTQRYSVRDGEALLRMVKSGLALVPLSRNKTPAARRRMELLGRDLTWVGVSDKIVALAQICETFGVTPAQVLHIGDAPDDAVVFAEVGVGVAVADAHPAALKAADVVLTARGGERALEELELRVADGQAQGAAR